MTARFFSNQQNTRGHRPRLQQTLLERDSQTKLDVTWSTLAENCIACIRRASGETESACGAGRGICAGSSEVRMIQQIEKLRPEFDSVRFSYAPEICARHLHILVSRSAEN